MISKNQIIEFGQKILEEKVATVMLIIMLTASISGSGFSGKIYFVSASLYTQLIVLLTIIIVIPTTRVFVENHIKKIKNVIAIMILIFTSLAEYVGNYGGLNMGGQLLTVLAVLLMLDSHPVIISSIKKWWKADKKEDNIES